MTDLSPRAMADVVVDAAGDKKAEDILVLNVSELTTIADLFVICTGRGERQVQAIADAVREKATLAGRRPIGVEGYSAGRWVLIDLGDVVVLGPKADHHAHFVVHVPGVSDGPQLRGGTARAEIRCRGRYRGLL